MTGAESVPQDSHNTQYRSWNMEAGHFLNQTGNKFIKP